MSAMPDTDILIIGGGLAGLSLACQLIDQNNQRPVTVLESRTGYTHDRTWSFWAPAEHRLQTLVKKRWSAWEYGLLDGANHLISHSNKPYQSIDSIDFYNHALGIIDRSKNTTLALGQSVVDCAPTGNGWRIRTTEFEFTAAVIIDTRPPDKTALAQSTLHQCFIGHIIRSPGAFVEDRIELMTDMASDEHGFLFTYCLPFDKDHALLEATRFAPQPLDWQILEADLHQLKQRRGWVSATIEHAERAILPMGLPARHSSDPSRVFAGTAAGGLRAATGYGFWRIQHWAQNCAALLVAGRPPIGHPPEPKIQAFMDALFLKVIHRYPERAPALFSRLLDALPPEVFIRFMSDESGLLDKLRVVMSLPKTPFLATIIKR